MICLAHIVSEGTGNRLFLTFTGDENLIRRGIEAAAISFCGINNLRLTRHAEVFGLLSLVSTLRAGWGFAFFLFEDFTLGMVVTVTGLKGHRWIDVQSSTWECWLHIREIHWLFRLVRQVMSSPTHVFTATYSFSFHFRASTLLFMELVYGIKNKLFGVLPRQAHYPKY